MLSFLFDHSESVQISLLNAYVIFQVLQSTIYEVDLDRILQSVHIYLQELGMEEIRRRFVLIPCSLLFSCSFDFFLYIKQLNML